MCGPRGSSLLAERCSQPLCICPAGVDYQPALQPQSRRPCPVAPAQQRAHAFPLQGESDVNVSEAGALRPKGRAVCGLEQLAPPA